MKLAVTLAILGLAAPALAVEPQVQTQAAVLTDSQLDQVTAGCATAGTPTALPSTPTNVNISPIVVNQTAVAFSQQNAVIKSHGKAKGHTKNAITQNATNVALNSVMINYHPKF
jgi:hypothetical protein